MGDVTAAATIPGAEFDAGEHGHDMASILRVAEMFGVTVPYVHGSRCLDTAPGGWLCTRLDDHTGRHHAAYPSPLGAVVLAVWHQQPW
jgi:hypothetical protein